MALSIDDLRTFILVSSERSVSKASAHLGVTQQSVSERIRRLERRVGVELFVRLPHGMQPSGAGFRLLPYARQAVELVDRALAVIDADDLVRARVQASVADLVVPLLGEGTTRVESTVTEDATGVLSAVVSGAADVGIGVFSSDDAAAFTSEIPSPSSLLSAPLPPAPGSNGHGTAPDGDMGVELDALGAARDDADGEAADDHAEGAESVLVIDHLFDDPVVWVVPPEHPLAVRGRAVPTAELSELAFGVALSGQPQAEGDGGSTEGLRLAPRSTVAGALADGSLVEVTVDLPGWVVPISIAYRATDHDRPTIAALRADLAAQGSRVEIRDAGLPQGSRR